MATLFIMSSLPWWKVDEVVFRTVSGAVEYSFNKDGDLRECHHGGNPRTVLSGWWMRRFATSSGEWEFRVKRSHSHLYEVKIFGGWSEKEDDVAVASFSTSKEAEVLQEVLKQHMKALEGKEEALDTKALEEELGQGMERMHVHTKALEEEALDTKALEEELELALGQGMGALEEELALGPLEPLEKALELEALELKEEGKKDHCDCFECVRISHGSCHDHGEDDERKEV